MQDQKRIIVTGAAGFIGSHLVEALLARGDAVVGVDNFHDYYDPAIKRRNVAAFAHHPAFTLAEADIRDREAMLRLLESHQPHAIAHLAAMPGVRYSIERASLYVEVNLQGTISLLDAARAVSVPQFVLGSTSSIYGAKAAIPFVESQPCTEPLAPYPASKQAAELMAFAYHNMFGINITALRFFTVYGPRIRPDLMAWKLMESAVYGTQVDLFAGGDMYRDWTYVSDIVVGVMAAIDRPLAYELINIGRGEPVHLKQFVEVIEELTGRPCNVRSVPAPPSEPPRTFASTEKAARLLGYQPQVALPEGLSRTWDWFREIKGLR